MILESIEPMKTILHHEKSELKVVHAKSEGNVRLNQVYDANS